MSRWAARLVRWLVVWPILALTVVPGASLLFLMEFAATEDAGAAWAEVVGTLRALFTRRVV